MSFLEPFLLYSALVGELVCRGEKGVVTGVNVGDYDFCSLPGEENGGFSTDALTCPCYYRDLAGE